MSKIPKDTIVTNAPMADIQAILTIFASVMLFTVITSKVYSDIYKAVLITKKAKSYLKAV